MNRNRLVSLILLSFVNLAYSQPIFLQHPSDVIASPGNKVSLECVIIDDQSSDLLDAQWYRNDIPTEGLPRHQNFRDLGTNLTIGLEIFNIMETDSGAMYHCTPNGQPQMSSRRASIIVAGVPKFQENDNIIAVVNTTVSSISIQWQPAIAFSIVPVTQYVISIYDDAELHSTFDIFTVTMLHFTFSQLKASTNYHISIVAINSVGPSKPTANFTVKTKSLSTVMPPTNVDVCVSFDRLGNPILQIQWQEPPNSDGQVNQYYVHYGRRGDITLEKILVNSVNATIQLSQDSLNETFVVQLSTVTESVESSMTIPVMQYINPLYSVEETSVSPSSATLQCRLACMTENLQCVITSINSVTSQSAAIMNVNRMSQQFFVLEGLQESMVYEYCISAYDSITNEPIGFTICGMFKTAVNLQSQPSSSDDDDDVPLSDAAVIGIIVGIIATLILTTIILIILLVFCCLKKGKESEEHKAAADLYAVTTVDPNCNSLPQANKNKTTVNYVDLDINAASQAPKIRDVSVSYAEVIIPKSRKEQANESSQQVNEDDQPRKLATLKFGYAELELSAVSIHSDTQSSTHVENDIAVTNSRADVA